MIWPDGRRSTWQAPPGGRPSELRIASSSGRASRFSTKQSSMRAGLARQAAALDANDAALAARRALRQNLADEELRIDKNFSAELERLRRLWAARAGR